MFNDQLEVSSHSMTQPPVSGSLTFSSPSSNSSELSLLSVSPIDSIPTLAFNPLENSPPSLPKSEKKSLKKESSKKRSRSISSEADLLLDSFQAPHNSPRLSLKRSSSAEQIKNHQDYLKTYEDFVPKEKRLDVISRHIKRLRAAKEVEQQVQDVTETMDQQFNISHNKNSESMVVEVLEHSICERSLQDWN